MEAMSFRFPGRNEMKRRPEEIEEQPKKRRKKKRRFGYYLYAVVILVLTITNISLATFLLTYVQRIEVKGTEHCNQTQVVEWIKEDPLTVNSLYTFCKFKIGKYQLPSCLEDVKVSFSAPWAIRVKVQEKQIAGCILTANEYVYFADDGTVLVKGREILEGIPVVEGLKVKETALYKKMKIGDDKVFSYVISISEEIKKNQLTPERLVWEDESMNLYFGEICVQLGKLNFDEKLVQLPPILEKLEGKSGTLHLEHYNEMSTSISFEETVPEEATGNE